jgi:hypothetical protein
VAGTGIRLIFEPEKRPRAVSRNCGEPVERLLSGPLSLPRDALLERWTDEQWSGFMMECGYRAEGQSWRMVDEEEVARGMANPELLRAAVQAHFDKQMVVTGSATTRPRRPWARSLGRRQTQPKSRCCVTTATGAHIRPTTRRGFREMWSGSKTPDLSSGRESRGRLRGKFPTASNNSNRPSGLALLRCGPRRPPAASPCGAQLHAELYVQNSRSLRC